MQGSETGRRPSLLNECRLSDGRLAWPVAQSSGVSEATFRARLKSGLSPDEAATRPVPVRDLERIAARRQQRRDYQARADHDAAAQRALRQQSLPVDRDISHDRYSRVCWSDGAIRLSRLSGAFHVQRRNDAGRWIDEYTAYSVADLRRFVDVLCLFDLPSGLVDHVRALPD